MTLEFISGDGQDGQIAEDANAFLIEALNQKRAEKEERLSAPEQPTILRSIQSFLKTAGVEVPITQQTSGLEDEYKFSDYALTLIKARGLTVVTLHVRSVIDYLKDYGENSIIIEQALKDNEPNYHELLITPSSSPRQIAYSPYQLLVPGSQNKGRVNQQESMDNYLERMFGLESGIVLPWMNVWEGLSFHELVYQQDEVPALAGKAIRCANALPNNDYACLGRPTSEVDQQSGRLFLERWGENATVERLGVFAVFQPAPMEKASQAASIEFWRKALSD